MGFLDAIASDLDSIFSTSEAAQEVELAGSTIPAVVEAVTDRDRELAASMGLVSGEVTLFIRNTDLPPLRVGERVTYQGRDYWQVAGLTDEGVITRIELMRSDG